MKNRDALTSSDVPELVQKMNHIDAIDKELKVLEDLNHHDCRIIGRTIFSPPLGSVPIPDDSVSRSQRGWLQDWALIELDQDKHTTSL